MRITNLTPHTINIHTENGGLAITPSGTVARVATTTTEEAPIEWDGLSIPVVSEEFGEVENLPAPQDGTIYIVSSIVQSAAKAQGRKDCYAPSSLFVRDKDGKIQGVEALKK